MHIKSTAEGWRAEAIAHEARETAPPVALVAMAVYAVFAVSHWLFLDGVARIVMASVAGASVVLIAVCYVLVRKDVIPGAWCLLAVLAIAGANSVLHMALTGEARQTTNFVILLVALGFFVLEIPLMATLVIALVAAWFFVMPYDLDEFLHYAFALLSAMVLAFTMGHIRRRVLFRLARVGLQQR